MNKFTPNFLIMIFTMLFVGLGLSYYSLTNSKFIGTYNIGSWTSWTNVGIPNPDPYTKAFVALGNTLQLGRSEGVQFTAQRDMNGELLQINCNYSVTGNIPSSSFWTLRALAPNGHSITPIGASQSVQSKRISRSTNGIVAINIGSKLASNNWLEIMGEGYFEIVLTLYDASVLSGFDSDKNTPPIIKNEGC